MSLLIMKTHRFLTLLYIGDTKATLVYTWYKIFPHYCIFCNIFCSEREKKESDENNIKMKKATRQRQERDETLLLLAT